MPPETSPLQLADLFAEDIVADGVHAVPGGFFREERPCYTTEGRGAYLIGEGGETLLYCSDGAVMVPLSRYGLDPVKEDGGTFSEEERAAAEVRSREYVRLAIEERMRALFEACVRENLAVVKAGQVESFFKELVGEELSGMVRVRGNYTMGHPMFVKANPEGSGGGASAVVGVRGKAGVLVGDAGGRKGLVLFLSRCYPCRVV